MNKGPPVEKRKNSLCILLKVSGSRNVSKQLGKTKPDRRETGSVLSVRITLRAIQNREMILQKFRSTSVLSIMLCVCRCIIIFGISYIKELAEMFLYKWENLLAIIGVYLFVYEIYKRIEETVASYLQMHKRWVLMIRRLLFLSCYKSNILTSFERLLGRYLHLLINFLLNIWDK